MGRVAAVLPGYATVKHASEVLHLAPRSVRDLIYSGRLPSVRVGHPYFVRAADLEVERRRRLGLRPPVRLARAPRARSSGVPGRQSAERRSTDPALRRQRAAEREAIVSQWAARHTPTGPGVPFMVRIASVPVTCEICSREIHDGRRMVMAMPDDAPLCLACGRRALLDWADHRRLEATAARSMAHELGAAQEHEPGVSQPRLVA